MSKVLDADVAMTLRKRNLEQQRRSAKLRSSSSAMPTWPGVRSALQRSPESDLADRHGPDPDVGSQSRDLSEEDGSNNSMKNHTGRRRQSEMASHVASGWPTGAAASKSSPDTGYTAGRAILIREQDGDSYLVGSPERPPKQRPTLAYAAPEKRTPTRPDGLSRSSPIGKDGLGQRQTTVLGRNSPTLLRHSHPSTPNRGHSYYLSSAPSPKLDPPSTSELHGNPAAPYLIDPEVKSPTIIRQPQARAISQEQLVAEVKGIYAGLVMIEAKCMDVDSKQTQAAQEAPPGKMPDLSQEQFQALIALHKTLLHEHHDFFLASQHPSASPALKRLAAKYAMPARMWRHGIHSFLELLRHRLPGSLEFMLQFIYLAYSMMALLYETVQSFKETWIECLGDLARYRMAIEDEDPRDRDIWTAVAREWYTRASDQNPAVGRLYHHLAILSRGNPMQQLYYYARSLTCQNPFLSTRESILSLFNPNLEGSRNSVQYNSLNFENSFVKCHRLLFNGNVSEFDEAARYFISHLDNYIGRVTARFKEFGVFIMVTNISALFEYGSSSSFLRLALERSITFGQKGGTVLQPSSMDVEMTGADTPAPSLPAIFPYAANLTSSVLSVAFTRLGDNNCLPLIHVSLIYVMGMSMVHSTWQYVEDVVPWAVLAPYLNVLIRSNDIDFEKVQAESLLKPVEEVEAEKHEDDEESVKKNHEGKRKSRAKNDEDFYRPLPEEYAIRGQLYSERYPPKKLFDDSEVAYEERNLERPSNLRPRIHRVLWLAVRLASSHACLKFDLVSKLFSVNSDVELPTLSHGLRQPKYTSSVAPSFADEDYEMSDIGRLEPIQDQIGHGSHEMDSGSSIRLMQRKSTSSFVESEVEMQGPAWAQEKSYAKPINPNNGINGVTVQYLLRNLNAFKNAVETAKEPVVVSNSVGVQLEQILREDPARGASAEAALEYIREAIDKDKNIKIVTADGHNLTRQGGFVAHE